MNVLNKGNLGRRILKRLLSLIIVVWGVVTLSFCLQVFTGTDPAEMIVRKNSLFATEEQIQTVREQLGLVESVFSIDGLGIYLIYSKY